MFRIGGSTFYDRKNKILMRVPEFKRSGIGLIAELHRILNGFPNQDLDTYFSRMGFFSFEPETEIDS